MTVTDSVAVDSSASVGCVAGTSSGSLPWSLAGGAKIGGDDMALPSVHVCGTLAARLRKPRSDRIVLAASGR